MAATLPANETQPLQISRSDEYGADSEDSPRYGWLGAKQRASDTPGGLVLMGVRLYNPDTGRFLTADPVYGGNANTYGYPADPVNMYDLDGQCNWVFHFATCARKAAVSWLGSLILDFVQNIVAPLVCGALNALAWACGAVVGGLIGAGRNILDQWANTGHVRFGGVLKAAATSALLGMGLSEAIAARYAQRLAPMFTRIRNFIRWWT